MEKVVVVFKTRTEHQETDKILETVLQSYFPKAGDREKIIQLFKQDLIDKKLGLNGYKVNSKIHFYFPISVTFDSKENN
jgi:hypothetical protein